MPAPSASIKRKAQSLKPTVNPQPPTVNRHQYWHASGYILMMSRISAGILLFRFENGTPEVLLVHPGGPFWINKDIGAWSIPKGEMEEGENTLETAKRELEEETGIKTEGELIELTPVRQSNKTIYAWAFRLNAKTDFTISNSFEMEWPPGSGKLKSFLEIDKAEWFNFKDAKIKIIKGQIPLIDELLVKLNAFNA